jgi:hypothetical protein
MVTGPRQHDSRHAVVNHGCSRWLFPRVAASLLLLAIGSGLNIDWIEHAWAQYLAGLDGRFVYLYVRHLTYSADVDIPPQDDITDPSDTNSATGQWFLPVPGLAEGRGESAPVLGPDRSRRETCRPAGPDARTKKPTSPHYVLMNFRTSKQGLYRNGALCITPWCTGVPLALALIPLLVRRWNPWRVAAAALAAAAIVGALNATRLWLFYRLLLLDVSFGAAHGAPEYATAAIVFTLGIAVMLRHRRPAAG